MPPTYTFVVSGASLTLTREELSALARSAEVMATFEYISGGRTVARRAEAKGWEYELLRSTNGQSGCYERVGCRVCRPVTDREAKEIVGKHAAARRERVERVLYLRKFTPASRRWIRGRRAVRCLSMWVFDGLDSFNTRRLPNNEDEVSFLRRLANDDVTGWAVYADWLDDYERGGDRFDAKHGSVTLAEKIRGHLRVNGR